MKKAIFLPLLVLSCSAFLGGCSMLPPGWAEYKSAMKCHFEGKDTECDKDYESAIKKNDKLPGVHASFATHLLKRGETHPAQEQFQMEVQNHPVSQTAVALVFKNVKHPDSTVTTLSKPEVK